MTKPDILTKLKKLHERWYPTQPESAETVQEAIDEINFLRRTARLPDSILTDPQAGVMGWGKGKDE